MAARRFGGRHSPGPRPEAGTPPAAPFRGRAAARVSVRARLMYLLPLPLLFAGLGAIRRGSAGEMLAELGGFLGLTCAAWLLNEGLRAEAAFARLPIILMTSRGDAEDVARGLELGADAYLTKQTFDQRQLLDTIRQLL